MLLNLNLIAGKLNTEWTLDSNITHLYDFDIEYAVLYEGQQTFYPSYLYVVRGNEVPEDPTFKGVCSFLSIGLLPDAYHQDCCDILCVKDLSMSRLFNRVSKIIRDYQQFELALINALQNPEPFKVIGDLLFEQFTNPIDLLNIGDRYLIRKYDPERPEHKEYYEIFNENSYPPLDELQVIYNTDGALQSFTYHEPHILISGMYKEKYLLSNIFDGQRYIGRLFVSDVYHPFRSADYSLLHYVSGMLKDIVDYTNTTVIINSRETDQLLRGLLDGTADYSSPARHHLSRQNWNPRDLYRIAVLCAQDTIKGNQQLAAHASYLRNIITDCYPLVMKENLILILHQQPDGSFDKQISLLKLFMQAERYQASFSDIFRNPQDMSVHYQQALHTSHLLHPGSHTARYFSDSVMECIFDICLKNQPALFYITEGLQKLMDYDLANQTELYKTLDIYLKNGMNASQTLNQLYIHRSTFTYRLGRIEKILGSSISNSKTRLYLEFAMELLSYSHENC